MLKTSQSKKGKKKVVGGCGGDAKRERSATINWDINGKIALTTLSETPGGGNGRFLGGWT